MDLVLARPCFLGNFSGEMGGGEVVVGREGVGLLPRLGGLSHIDTLSVML